MTKEEKIYIYIFIYVEREKERGNKRVRGGLGRGRASGIREGRGTRRGLRVKKGKEEVKIKRENIYTAPDHSISLKAWMRKTAVKS